MRLTPTDPDLETLVRRIKAGDLDLQPDFQRGEVWGDPKKRRLIDTILRGWHVPPVHVVVDPTTGRQHVLDGQQRLAAIRDFYSGGLVVDGTCHPHDATLEELHGRTYMELPDVIRRKLNQYALRVIKLTDFTPEEPGELFFRLNQPTNLTAAEQRNAFFGPARNQVKHLVRRLGDVGLNKKVLGFNNSRMAYDDVIAKVCYTLQVGTLRRKVTAGVVTDFFRSGSEYSEATVSGVDDALAALATMRSDRDVPVRFNKATLYTWLVFIARLHAIGAYDRQLTGGYLHLFEQGRAWYREQSLERPTFLFANFPAIHAENLAPLFELFNNRASSRVADVSSVAIRDLLLWVFATGSLACRDLVWPNLTESRRKVLSRLHTALAEPVVDHVAAIVELVEADSNWGDYEES